MTIGDNGGGAWTTCGPHDSRSRGPCTTSSLQSLRRLSSNATRKLSNSCYTPFFGLCVDRVSRSRSTEWRHARDTPAPEISPATRANGSHVGLRAGPLLDSELWRRNLVGQRLTAPSVHRPTRILYMSRISFGTPAVSNHGLLISNISSSMGRSTSRLLYVSVAMDLAGRAANQSQVMERACKQLPRSYKLWKMVRCFLQPHLFALKFADLSSTWNSARSILKVATPLYTDPNTRRSTHFSSGPLFSSTKCHGFGNCTSHSYFNNPS